ncbi:hypothetical protein ES703_87946 [subsurface metagenome]
MVGGFAGAAARVNLSTGEVRTEKLNEEWVRLFIGGRGYGAKLIYDEVDPKVGPFAPENKVVIATGPTNGSRVPASSRTVVVTKSPLNDVLACSNAGGFFGSELKRAGYDAVILEGKSSKPVYLWINDGVIEVRDAKHVWGKKLVEIDQTLKQETDPKARVMAIGSAGVKLSRIAAVMVDVNRASGRSGVGAVLGSKNFLGIVARGTKKIEVADPEGLKEVNTRVRKLMKENPVDSDALPTYGTSVLVNIINEIGGYPTRNALDAYFPTANLTGGEAIVEKILIKRGACATCFIKCGRITKIRTGQYAGESGEGPEYETTWALGVMCGIDDLNAITKANYLCNEYGLDTISAGSTIACAMELYEKGYIPETEAPFSMKFGDADALVKLVDMMGKREGIGNLLAEGSYRLAEHYGHPELSMSVKKLEFPAYDPRAIKGIGLQYATSNRGACHVRGYTISSEILGLPTQTDRLKYEGKAELVKAFQDLTAVIDSSGMCLFTFFALGGVPEVYAQILTASTGISYSTEEMLKAGERIWNLEKLWNLKVGYSKKDDALPPRMSEFPIASGPSKGEVCQIYRMLPEYYKLRGWDEEGRPTKEKLQDLGLR